MKIELTEHQRQALREREFGPVEVIDPATALTYVILARDQYERMRSLSETGHQQESRLPDGILPIPPGVRRSQEAYWRDLPELLCLRSRIHRWVAYHGDERIALGRTATELYQECFKRGLPRNQIFVGILEASEVPPWGTLQADWSLYEVTEAATPRL